LKSDVLTYKDYYATVYYSEEDEVFFGKIEGVSDSITFEGESVKELKKAFIDSVEDYIEMCKEIGKVYIYNPCKSRASLRQKQGIQNGYQ
jgi:predicted HicB family RNase H-like nuclease